MSTSLNIKAYASKDSEEFKKHFKLLKLCIDSKVSFPKETVEFFKDSFDGDNMEDIQPKYILEYIEHGIEVPLTLREDSEGDICIMVSEIPKKADAIRISIS